MFENLEQWYFENGLRLLYVLLGRAAPSFPTTTRSHPSKEVVVLLLHRSLIRPGHKAYFPWVVSGDVWEYAAKVVLSDPAVRPMAALNQQQLCFRSEEYAKQLGQRYYEKLIELGLIPTEDQICP